jgi:hypothetical protein
MSTNIKYIIKIDPAIDEEKGTYFFNRVTKILNMDKRWPNHNFIYIGGEKGHNTPSTPPTNDYDVIITLLTREKKHILLAKTNSILVDQPGVNSCGDPIDHTKIEFSYTFYTTPKVIIIDNTNWENAHSTFTTPIAKEYYEMYVIFHEMGHAIGKSHKEIPVDETKPYPIMYQATLGICDNNRFLPFPNESDDLF